jgi:acyl carrier protein
MEEARMTVDFSAPVRQFISENFLFREDMDDIADEASFVQAGILDSTGVLELIAFLEERYGIEIADEEMLPSNFDSIRAVAAYLKRKLEGGARGADLRAQAEDAEPAHAG